MQMVFDSYKLGPSKGPGMGAVWNLEGILQVYYTAVTHTHTHTRARATSAITSTTGVLDYSDLHVAYGAELGYC